MNPLDNPLNVREEVKGDVLILKISGRLDAITSPQIERKIFDHIQNNFVKLLLDLSGVDYLSSAGLRMLLCVSKKLKALSGQVILFAITQNVLDVLKMSGFDNVLEMTTTEDEAFKKL